MARWNVVMNIPIEGSESDASAQDAYGRFLENYSLTKAVGDAKRITVSAEDHVATFVVEDGKMVFTNTDEILRVK